MAADGNRLGWAHHRPSGRPTHDENHHWASTAGRARKRKGAEASPGVHREHKHRAVATLLFYKVSLLLLIFPAGAAVACDLQNAEVTEERAHRCRGQARCAARQEMFCSRLLITH